ncbi:MAG: hypothetical protein ACP5U1_14100 [Desulfomonilaceae bacterium]
MKTFLGLCVVVLIATVSFAGDSYYFDRHGNYKGWARDNSDSTEFFDKHNSYRGFYDKSTGIEFDSHNNVEGQWMGDSDDD